MDWLGLPGSRASLVYAAALVAFAAQMAGQSPKNNPQNSRVERGRQFLGLAPPPDPAAAARGEKLFVQNCGFCHGNNARGAEGPDLLRSALVLHDAKGEVLGPFLHNGRPDKGMPAFAALTDPQTYDIAEFLHAQVDAAANRSGYKVQNVVTGSAPAGEEYFNGAGHCNQCHSPTGDLAHIASKFEPADLQAQFLYPSASGSDQDERHSLAPKVKVTLPSGETVSGVLKRVDDFNISIYDSSGAYHEWSRGSVKVEIDDPLQAHRELLSKYTDSDMHNVLAYLETLK